MKLDPSQSVVARVDDLTVEMRIAPSVNEAAGSVDETSAAELLVDLGPWEGESDEEFAKLWQNVRQKTNRVVPDFDR
ncbi:MAG TPA: hypothetical protein VH062_11895 [Polyangiaceae bacterium]|nr:hypothetical protein [Polyangiaceae bacterium]